MKKPEGEERGRRDEEGRGGDWRRKEGRERRGRDGEGGNELSAGTDKTQRDDHLS